MVFLIYLKNPFPTHSNDFVIFLKNITRTKQIKAFQMENNHVPFYFLFFAYKSDLLNAINALVLVREEVKNLEFFTESGYRTQSTKRSKWLNSTIGEYAKSLHEEKIINKFLGELEYKAVKSPREEMEKIYEKLLENWKEHEKEIREQFFKKLRTVTEEKKHKDEHLR